MTTPLPRATVLWNVNKSDPKHALELAFQNTPVDIIGADGNIVCSIGGMPKPRTCDYCYQRFHFDDPYFSIHNRVSQAMKQVIPLENPDFVFKGWDWTEIGDYFGLRQVFEDAFPVYDFHSREEESATEFEDMVQRIHERNDILDPYKYQDDDEHWLWALKCWLSAYNAHGEPNPRSEVVTSVLRQYMSAYLKAAEQLYLGWEVYDTINQVENDVMFVEYMITHLGSLWT